MLWTPTIVLSRDCGVYSENMSGSTGIFLRDLEDLFVFKEIYPDTDKTYPFDHKFLQCH